MEDKAARDPVRKSGSSRTGGRVGSTSGLRAPRPGSRATSARLRDRLTGIDAIATDLDLRVGTACSTFRVRRLTVVGA